MIDCERKNYLRLKKIREEKSMLINLFKTENIKIAKIWIFI
jgi:hypothetical protein